MGSDNQDDLQLWRVSNIVRALFEARYPKIVQPLIDIMPDPALCAHIITFYSGKFKMDCRVSDAAIAEPGTLADTLGMFVEEYTKAIDAERIMIYCTVLDILTDRLNIHFINGHADVIRNNTSINVEYDAHSKFTIRISTPNVERIFSLIGNISQDSISIISQDSISIINHHVSQYIHALSNEHEADELLSSETIKNMSKAEYADARNSSAWCWGIDKPKSESTVAVGFKSQPTSNPISCVGIHSFQTYPGFNWPPVSPVTPPQSASQSVINTVSPPVIEEKKEDKIIFGMIIRELDLS